MTLVDSSCRQLALVTAELGVSMTALKGWVMPAHDAPGGAIMKPDQPVDATKYKALEVRLKEVKKEN